MYSTNIQAAEFDNLLLFRQIIPKQLSSMVKSLTLAVSVAVFVRHLYKACSDVLSKVICARPPHLTASQRGIDAIPDTLLRH